jgi:hypothetical protein
VSETVITEKREKIAGGKPPGLLDMLLSAEVTTSGVITGAPDKLKTERETRLPKIAW